MSDAKLNDTHGTVHPFSLQLKWNDFPVIGHTDAAQGARVDGCSTGGYVLTMTPYRQSIEGHMTDMSLIGLSTNKLKRVARSSLIAEIQEACNIDDELFPVHLLWSDINRHQVKQNVTDAVKATPGIIVLDAKGVCECVTHQQVDSFGPDWKTMRGSSCWNPKTVSKCTTRIFDGVTGTFSWLVV